VTFLYLSGFHGRVFHLFCSFCFSFTFELHNEGVEVGPMTFTRQDHEKVVLGPSKMVVIPPRHYCTVKDPYIRKNEQTKEPEMDKFNQIMLRHGNLRLVLSIVSLLLTWIEFLRRRGNSLC